MDKPKTTAKDFFLWAGAIISFYWSVIATIFLIFNYIDYTFLNALAYNPDPYQSGIPYQMASIIVLLPLYLVLMRFIRHDITQDPSRKEIWVRRWALILTLFVAGIAMAGDLIALLTTFLSGAELTTSFLLKVLVIFIFAGAVFAHFIADLKGYWETYPARKRSVAIAVAVLAMVVIVAGFFIVGTPAQARLARYDAVKITDLQNIQYQVIGYYQAKQKLPAVIADLNNSLNYGPVPTDPQSGESYIYQATGALSFKLCATFNTESRVNSNPLAETRAVMPVSVGGKVGAPDNWQHGSGQVCFERAIDPAFYPPISKIQP